VSTSEIPERIETERLLLRRYEKADAPRLLAVVSSSRDHLLPWLPWARVNHRSLDESERFCDFADRKWASREELMYGIFGRHGVALLGGIGLMGHDWANGRFEIGYWLAREAQGHGYMQEAVRALTELAFDQLGARRIQIRADEGNLRSQAVAERCGYQYEESLPRKADDPDRGILGDLRVYALERLR
jgi:RimJ/RimL family protein N-acetyltransferase